MATSVPESTVVTGDVLKVLPLWPPECVDLVFADPPFNIGYQYDKYRDDLAPPAYVACTRRWIEECLRLLKPSGTLWIAIGDEYAAEVRVLMREKATLRNWIIWPYTFGQCCKAKFNRAHAHRLYFVRDIHNYTFHDEAVARAGARAARNRPGADGLAVRHKSC